ncbi:MAG: nitronate monooxygenase [Candidatus Paceibacteria bacterium]|jgi:nitronate monooxygenase
MSLPTIIQGGMGAGVSSWALANTVSRAGQLGVVSGTALDVILARRLQLGDIGGHMRRALKQFPIPAMAEEIIERYFVPDGKGAGDKFRSISQVGEVMSEARTQLTVVANFVEVFLAREGHDNDVGVNYLEKIQFPNLPSIFGALLGGAGYILMGAGIPVAIPGVIDRLTLGQAVELRLDVQDATSKYFMEFDPAPYLPNGAEGLVRPKFLAIVSSVTVASVMVKKGSGRTDGLIIEGATAGGHNAPPRGQLQLDDKGEPVYGKRDIPNIEGIAALGIPFWLAGSCGSPEELNSAIAHGATGVQVGTAFAFCSDSGLDEGLRQRAMVQIKAGTIRVKTDPLASPTGFPFKILEMEGTLAMQDLFEERPKICDLGYLRQPYETSEGRFGWRCASEPDQQYERKGGQPEKITGRKCVCNGLLANIGMAQVKRGGKLELPLITCGDDLDVVRRLAAASGGDYGATDVLDYLLSPVV